MKYNLKNFPKCQTGSKFYKWKEGFEAELREIQKTIDLLKHDIYHDHKGTYINIKEILGE